jgi:hypothetical protein
MKSRIKLLKNKILPKALSAGFDEIFVAGRPDDSLVGAFPKIMFLHIEPLTRTREEALHIREVATRYATGDILTYMADDHSVANSFVENMPTWEWDVLTPQRIHGITKQELNNGRPDGPWKNWNGYSPAHCQILKRRVWAQTPWESLHLTPWDVSMTRLWREMRFKVVWTDEIKCVDLEIQKDQV